MCIFVEKAIVKNRIQSLRKLLDLTQEGVANAMDMKLTTYKHKENGTYDFTIYEAYKLAEVLNTTVDIIFLNVSVNLKCSNDN